MSDTSPVADLEQTEVGSYFVANYPPFSVWTADAVATDAQIALESPGQPATPPGTAVQLRILGRCPAVVSDDPPARAARHPRDGEPLLGHCGGNHIRVRARHYHSCQAGGDPGHWRHPPQPRRREP